MVTKAKIVQTEVISSLETYYVSKSIVFSQTHISLLISTSMVDKTYAKRRHFIKKIRTKRCSLYINLKIAKILRVMIKFAGAWNLT